MTFNPFGIRIGRVFAVGVLAFATSVLLVMLVIFVYAFTLGFQARGQPDQSAILMADGPYVMKDTLRDSILGVATPPLKELFQFAVDHKLHIYV